MLVLALHHCCEKKIEVFARLALRNATMDCFGLDGWAFESTLAENFYVMLLCLQRVHVKLPRDLVEQLWHGCTDSCLYWDQSLPNGRSRSTELSSRLVFINH